MTAVDAALDGDRLDEAEAHIAAAWAEVERLCTGGLWTMRIPVDEASDSDTVIAAALTDAKALLAAARAHAALLADYRALAEELEAWRDNATRFTDSAADGNLYQRALGRARAYDRAAARLREIGGGAER